MTIVAELLARFGSCAAPATEAVLIRVDPPGVLTATVSVIVAEAPLSSVPRLQATLPVVPGPGDWQVPSVVLPLTKDTPGGSVSFRTTAGTAVGPPTQRRSVAVEGFGGQEARRFVVPQGGGRPGRRPGG